jgi:hypothetical protein
MALPDVKIIKGKGGLGRLQPTQDGVSGLAIQGVAVTDGLQLNTAYELRGLADLEALKVTADAPVGTLYFHVKEFFRMNPSGILWLYVVDRTVTLDAMADKLNLHAKALIQAATGKIRQLGLALNRADGALTTTVDGLDSEVVAAIPKAQALAVEAFAEHRPLEVLIAGQGLTGLVSAMKDLRAAGAENVSIVVAADHGNKPGVPALGTALGAVSLANVHENIGWVSKFNLASDGAFLQAGLSNGSALSAMTSGDLAGLHEKGYIFGRTHTGIDGVFFNDSHTCTVATSDYAYIENNRTMHKAARLIRTVLLPFVNGPVPMQNGQISAPFVAEMEAKATTMLESNMSRNGELSELEVYIDPTQDVLASSQIVVDFRLVPVGVGRAIVGKVGFVKEL